MAGGVDLVIFCVHLGRVGNCTGGIRTGARKIAQDRNEVKLGSSGARADNYAKRTRSASQSEAKQGQSEKAVRRRLRRCLSRAAVAPPGRVPPTLTRG